MESINNKFAKCKLAALLSCLTLAACGGSDDGSAVDSSPADPPAATTQDVTIKFAAYAGNDTVSCDAPVNGLGTGAVTAKVRDFRFFVSNVYLVASDGSEVALDLKANDDWNVTVGDDRVSLIDLENGADACENGNPEMNAEITGSVASGDYTGFKATIGVPYALNHSDYATSPAPLDLQSMGWSWQSGRKFTKIEVTDPDGAEGNWTDSSFFFHLGSTGCEGNPATGETVACGKQNRMSIVIGDFDFANEQVAVDLQAMLEGNDVTVNEKGAPGCMSGPDDPECEAVFDAIAIDWKADGTGTGLPIDEGQGQRLFRAVSR